MAIDYKQAIVITGGKLIRNEASNTENFITFQKTEDDKGKVYLDINVKIRIAETEIINTVRSIESFKDVNEITNTKNLVVLGTTKRVVENKTVYKLSTSDTAVDINFDKNNSGQIGIQITAFDIIKTDHGVDPGKTDHSYIPF